MSDKLKSLKSMMEVMNARNWEIVANQVWTGYGTEEAVFIASVDNPVIASYLIESRTIIPWLIEQLEQAQQENERLKEVDQQGIKCQMEYARQNKLLVEQNQKLVECLEWYADEDTWLEPDGAGILPIDYDEGKRARTVLQEVQHGTSTE